MAELDKLIAVFGPTGGLLVVAVVLLWRQYTGLSSKMLDVINANTAALTALESKIDGGARSRRK
jgi:hypothetical protein